MKKGSLLLAICILTVVLLSGCNKANSNKDNITSTKDKVINTDSSQVAVVEFSDGNFVDIQKNFNSLQENADTTVIGKVKSSYSYKFIDLICTNYVVEVKKQIKNEKNSFPKEIEIRVTGGLVGDESQEFFDKTKTLEKNQTYFFALKKVFPNKPDNNYYAILGGEYQGVFKVKTDDKNKILKVDKFNENNDLEDGLINYTNIEESLKTK